jgi:hypothetical protein
MPGDILIAFDLHHFPLPTIPPHAAELPEVEAARRLAHKHCQGKKIVHAYISDDESAPWIGLDHS